MLIKFDQHEVKFVLTEVLGMKAVGEWKTGSSICLGSCETGMSGSNSVGSLLATENSFRGSADFFEFFRKKRKWKLRDFRFSGFPEKVLQFLAISSQNFCRN